MLHFPLPLVHYCLTHKYNTLHNTLHSSCCNSHWNSLFALAFELLQPANTTALTTPSSFRVAFHQLSSIIHGLFYYWLFSQQTQPQLHWLHPLHFVLQFPLPLGSHFPPPLTTQTTSCSIVPSPTSKHSTFHISCCISHCHQLASTTCIDNTLHSSCCISHWHSLFALATTSKHNCIDYTLFISCCIPPVVINHPRVVLLLIVQPANTTTTALTTPSTFRVAIPIATRFTFPTAIDYSNYKLFYRPFSN